VKTDECAKEREKLAAVTRPKLWACVAHLHSAPMHGIIY